MSKKTVAPVSNRDEEPRTLLEAIRYFADKDKALAFVARLRWPQGPVCPECAAKDIAFLATRRLWKCRACKKQFSVKVGTIFEDSPLGLDKWLPALWLLANCKNDISSYELARDLGVTQKTAWFMLHRIRLAMQSESFGQMEGEVEVDETYIGGSARFIHKSKKDRVIKGQTGMVGKAAVMGLLERHGLDKETGEVKCSTVRAKPVKSTRRKDLLPEIRANVRPGAEVFTDAHPSYNTLVEEYAHQAIDHAESYAEGKVHTNGLENFWSLLKRGIKGTYIAVEPFHLFRYVDEQVRRFNERDGTDWSRFVSVVRDIAGRRLTYRHLTGADLSPTGA
jgi:transposase-like protein